MLQFPSLFLDHLWTKVKKVSCLAPPVKPFSLLLIVLVNKRAILSEIMEYLKGHQNIFILKKIIIGLFLFHQKAAVFLYFFIFPL